jgi:hypothetical protein
MTEPTLRTHMLEILPIFFRLFHIGFTISSRTFLM